MALIFTDGFEYPRQRGFSSISGQQPLLGYLNASSVSLTTAPIKEGINGHNYIRISSSGSLITQIPSAISSGILSFLSYTIGGGSLSAYTFASVNSDEQEIVSIRTVSYSSTFPSGGYVMELFAGGVQIGTFFWPMNNFNIWARWTLVWSTEGESVTAALYREGQLILQGTGGQTGINSLIDSYTFRSLGRSSSTDFDSVTVWNNAVEDIQKARSPHWIGISRLSEDFIGLPQQGFTTFSGTSFPSSSYQTLASALITTSNDVGILTINPAAEDFPLVIPEIEDVATIHGISMRTTFAGVGDLTTASNSFVLENTTTNPVSKDSSELSLLYSVIDKNPVTNLPWEPPTKHILIDPNADGGFESGSTFEDNGWTVLNPTDDRMKWFCGSAGAITGTNGAFLSRQGFESNIPLNTFFYSYIMREVTIPENINQILLEFSISGGGTNATSSSYTIDLSFGIIPLNQENLWYLSSPNNGTLDSYIKSSSFGYDFVLKGSNSTSLFSSGRVDAGTNPGSIYGRNPYIRFRNQIAMPISYKTDFKKVIPGQEYMLVFGTTGYYNMSVAEPIRLDNISLIGYEGDITKLNVRLGAS